MFTDEEIALTHNALLTACSATSDKEEKKKLLMLSECFGKSGFSKELTGENSDTPVNVILSTRETKGLCQSINIAFSGHSDCYSEDDKGPLISVEYNNELLTLTVWADINQEDPTHIISLSDAQNTKRQEAISS